MIVFACQCGKRIKVEDRHAGKSSKCPGCGRSITVPAAATTGESRSIVTLSGTGPAASRTDAPRESAPPAPVIEARAIDVTRPTATVLTPAPVAAPIPAPATKDCHYCGEQILVTARKCRHCGEILDLALRAAEEAKQMARDQAARNQQLVINNNNNVSTTAVASATAFVAVPRRDRLARSCIAFVLFCLAIVAFGGMLASVGHDAGWTLVGLGVALLFIGVPIYILRFTLRAIFG